MLFRGEFTTLLKVTSLHNKVSSAIELRAAVCQRIYHFAIKPFTKPRTIL